VTVIQSRGMNVRLEKDAGNTELAETNMEPNL